MSAPKKPSIKEVRRKAVYNWACNRPASELASLMLYMMSSREIKHIYEEYVTSKEREGGM